MRQIRRYRSISQCSEEPDSIPVEFGCACLHISRTAYYAWLSGKMSKRDTDNARLAEKIEQIHTENPDKGYRRIRDDLEHDYGIRVNNKRVLRLCRAKSIRSTIKYRNNGCTRHAADPQYLAENILNRDFHADKPDTKWLTDVTEFKWYEGVEVHKLYLCAILDLYDRRITTNAYQSASRVRNRWPYQTHRISRGASPCGIQHHQKRAILRKHFRPHV